jgi:hypothetical protein
VVQVNGVRDRLRVLLVSGEPNQDERTWRRLLKSDPAVDLVHFTILRPPERDDLTPLNELALIAFPTRELFQEKLSASPTSLAPCRTPTSATSPTTCATAARCCSPPAPNSPDLAAWTKPHSPKCSPPTPPPAMPNLAMPNLEIRAS